MTTPGPSGSDFPGGAPATGSPFGGSTLGSVSRAISSPRAMAAWALVTYVGLELFFAFFLWILPDAAHTFSARSENAKFHTISIIALPVLAVLLASQVAPTIARAKMIASIALIEYAVALFFGFITLLTGLGRVFDAVQTAADGFGALRYLVMGVAELILIAIAATVALRSFLNGGHPH